MPEKNASKSALKINPVSILQQQRALDSANIKVLERHDTKDMKT